MNSTDGRSHLLWERQPWDTNASYKAFKDYYLPAEEPGRLLNAYREYGREKGVRKRTWKLVAVGTRPPSYLW